MTVSHRKEVLLPLIRGQAWHAKEVCFLCTMTANADVPNNRSYLSPVVADAAVGTTRRVSEQTVRDPGQRNGMKCWGGRGGGGVEEASVQQC